MREYTLSVYTLIEKLGIILCTVVVVVVIVLLLHILYKLFKNNEKVKSIVDTIKYKFMWSPIIRMIFSGYLVQTYTQMKAFDHSLI